MLSFKLKASSCKKLGMHDDASPHNYAATAQIGAC